ncbi:hypothetical protein HaLaN_23217, partial [Haematococcus lacustris]
MSAPASAGCRLHLPLSCSTFIRCTAGHCSAGWLAVCQQCAQMLLKGERGKRRMPSAGPDLHPLLSALRAARPDLQEAGHAVEQVRSWPRRMALTTSAKSLRYESSDRTLQQAELSMTFQASNENLHDFMLSPCAPCFE